MQPRYGSNSSFRDDGISGWELAISRANDIISATDKYSALGFRARYYHWSEKDGLLAV